MDTKAKSSSNMVLRGPISLVSNVLLIFWMLNTESVECVNYEDCPYLLTLSEMDQTRRRQTRASVQERSKRALLPVCFSPSLLIVLCT
jgi:hypothetical protein